MCLLGDLVKAGPSPDCTSVQEPPRAKPGEAICCFVVVVVVAAVVLVLCPCPCEALVIVGKYDIKSFFEAWNLEGE